MKNLLFLFIAIYFTFLSCNNKKEGKNPDSGKREEFSGKMVVLGELKESGGIQYFAGAPFTGIAFDMWDEKQTKTEASYKDGKLDGLHKTYYKNGQLEEKVVYEDGKISDGMQTGYFESGKLQFENFYKSGENIEYKEYYESGKIKFDYRSSDSGVLKKQYYESGQLQREDKENADGSPIYLKQYNKNGQLEFERRY